ncbi:Coiled-coil domain-containing protein 58 [Nymphon striatum]|nr:Coiled-coil domain-containing protein 58 [Nymphon striatum]
MAAFMGSVICEDFQEFQVCVSLYRMGVSMCDSDLCFLAHHPWSALFAYHHSYNSYRALLDALRKMRKVDDNIIYALNTTIPTASFKHESNATNQCKDLYDELTKSNLNRENSIKKCLTIVSSRVKDLKKIRDSNMDDVEVTKNLRSSQTKLRLMQNELTVEEVIQDRTKKVYHERCRDWYKPPKQEFTACIVSPAVGGHLVFSNNFFFISLDYLNPCLKQQFPVPFILLACTQKWYMKITYGMALNQMPFGSLKISYICCVHYQVIQSSHL